MTMFVFIPTTGRKDRQITLSQIPHRWKKHTYLVVSDRVNEYQYSVTCLPCDVQGISNVRQWIIQHSLYKYVFMMDDDLVFHKRDHNKRLVKAAPDDVGAMLDLMYKWLEKDRIPCVGLTARFGNNWLADNYVECHRPCMAYGFDVNILNKNGIQFNKFPVGEDYHVFLSLLKLGYKNRMSTDYTVSSNSVNKNGGCSDYRTQTMVEDAMKGLIEYHKPYIKYRKSKGLTQGFPIGKELQVQWKRAYADGRST